MPVLAVIGGFGTFTVWCVVVATHPFGRTVGFIWMGLGLLMYVGYRKVKGYSLTKTVEKIVVPLSMQADIDYDQILVPITGTCVSDEMMVLACQLATEKKSAIDGLFVIEVPLNLPLDARLINERAKADKVLKAAAVIASQFKVKFTPQRGDGATGRQGDRRDGRRAPQRGHHARHHAQAPHRQPDVRAGRRTTCSTTRRAKSSSTWSPGTILRRVRASWSELAAAGGRRHPTAGGGARGPKLERLRRVPCMS